MATLTVGNVVQAGVAENPGAAAAGGDEFANPDDQRTFLLVYNDSTNARTVTITPANSSHSVPGKGTLTQSALAVEVTNQRKLIGPFPAAVFNNTNGRVAVTYSSTSNITVQALRMAAL